MGIGFKELIVILIIVLVYSAPSVCARSALIWAALIKGFRKAVKEGEEAVDGREHPDAVDKVEAAVIEGEATATKHNDKVSS